MILLAAFILSFALWGVALYIWWQRQADRGR